MKAITKDGKSYDVRFKIFNIKTFFFHAHKDQWWNNTAEICVDGNWYHCTVAAHWDKDTEYPVVSLGKEASEVLGVEYSFMRRTRIKLSDFPKEEWQKFFSTSMQRLLEDANKIQFNKIEVRQYASSEWYFCNWDSNDNLFYANYNEKATDLKLSFACAYKANRGAMDKYIKKDSLDGYMFTYSISLEDIDELNEIGKEEKKKVEERKKKQAWLDERIAEMRKNIKNGAVYFHCESAPHDEDLSNVILARPCPNDGSFTLMHHIEKDKFNLIKEFGVYWDADFLEDCDMFFSAPGWRFTYHAIETLRKHNIRTFIDYREIS